MIQPSLDLSGYHTPYNNYPISSAGFKSYGTSSEAAEQISPTIKKAHEDLIHLLVNYPQGLTADEAGELLGWSLWYARPRVSELHGRGLIKKTGRGVNASGKSAYTWGLT